MSTCRGRAAAGSRLTASRAGSARKPTKPAAKLTIAPVRRRREGLGIAGSCPLNLFSRGGAASGKTPSATGPGTASDLADRRVMSQIVGGCQRIVSLLSALAGFEPTLRLINHIDAALAPHDAIVAMAAAQRFQ